MHFLSYVPASAATLTGNRFVRGADDAQQDAFRAAQRCRARPRVQFAQLAMKIPGRYPYLSAAPVKRPWFAGWRAHIVGPGVFIITLLAALFVYWGQLSASHERM